jgi:tRNA G10  N-methylase Trm11
MNIFAIFISKNQQIKNKTHIMLTRDKIAEIFCLADDFCKDYEQEVKKHQLPSNEGKKRRNRSHEMSESEIMTILLCFHFALFPQFQPLLSVLCGGAFKKRVPPATVL